MDAEHITKLKDSLLAEYGQQRALDAKMLELYQQKHVIEGRKPQEITFRPVGSGLAGLVVDQDIAVLSGDVSFRVAPRGGAAAEKHASDVLEPFVQTAWDVMQEDTEVWSQIVQDSRIYGRAWALGPLPAPFFWGDDSLKGMYERLEEARGKKKDEIRGEIDDYKEGHFPIVWRHWQAPDVMCTWNQRGQPDEVIYCRKASARSIQREYGEDALPARNKEYADAEELEVLYYVDQRYYAVVIPDKKDPKMAKVWEHRMGRTPVTFCDGGRLPENPQKWMWAGAVFHLRELIPSIDDTLTDIRTIIRESPTSPPVVYLNVDARGQFDGWPTNIQVKQGETVNLLIDERIERAPVPTANLDLYQYLGVARSFADMVGARRDALGGAGMGPSGQSAVHLNEANQIAKAELKRPHKGLERAATGAGKLVMRSVIALSEEFPDAPDKVTIRPVNRKAKSKPIEVGPEDVKGWEPMLRASIDLALPVAENQQVLNFKMSTESQMLDMNSARERYGNIANPAEIDDKRHEWMWGEAIAQLATNMMLSRAGGALERATVSEAQLQQKYAQLPEFAQEVFTRFGTGGTEGTRGAMNGARTGRGQNLSTLQGTQTELPGGV